MLFRHCGGRSPRPGSCHWRVVAGYNEGIKTHPPPLGDGTLGALSVAATAAAGSGAAPTLRVCDVMAVSRTFPPRPKSHAALPLARPSAGANSAKVARKLPIPGSRRNKRRAGEWGCAHAPFS